MLPPESAVMYSVVAFPLHATSMAGTLKDSNLIAGRLLTEGSRRRATTRRKLPGVPFYGTNTWSTSSLLTEAAAGLALPPGEIEFRAQQRTGIVAGEYGPKFSRYVPADPNDNCGSAPGGVRELTVVWEDDDHVTVRWKEPRNEQDVIGGLPITRYELGDVSPGNCPDSRFPFREVRITDDAAAQHESYEHRLQISANTIEAIGVRAVNGKGHGPCVTATVEGQGGTAPSAPTWTAGDRSWTCDAPDAPRCRAHQQIRVSTGVAGRKEVQLRYTKRAGGSAQESGWTSARRRRCTERRERRPVQHGAAEPGAAGSRKRRSQPRSMGRHATTERTSRSLSPSPRRT